MKRKYQILGFIILLLCSVIYDYQKPEKMNNKIKEPSSYVILEGAFLKQGKYEFDGQITIQDIVNDIGVSSQANLQALSLNTLVKDESTLYLPVICDHSISLNTASKEELMTLERIGDKTAQKIIDYRNQQPFLYIEDIMNVPGIGEKMYMRIRDRLCL